MPLIYMHPRSNQSNNGFNLIEAAIVLAVVGFVIGGIWIAASAVNESLKVSQTIKATFRIIEGTRILNQNFTPNTLVGAGAVGSSIDLLDTIKIGGIIPQDTFFNCSSGSCDGLWGSTSGIRLEAVKGSDTTGDYYMQLWAPVSACIKIGRALAGISFSQYRIKQIDMSPQVFTDGASMTLSNIVMRCNLDTTYAIYFKP